MRRANFITKKIIAVEHLGAYEQWSFGAPLTSRIALLVCVIVFRTCSVEMSGRFSRTIYVGNLPADKREWGVEDLFYKVKMSDGSPSRSQSLSRSRSPRRNRRSPSISKSPSPVKSSRPRSRSRSKSESPRQEKIIN